MPESQDTKKRRLMLEVHEIKTIVGSMRNFLGGSHSIPKDAQDSIRDLVEKTERSLDELLQSIENAFKSDFIPPIITPRPNPRDRW